MNKEGWKETVRHLSLEEFRVLQEVIWEEYRAREAQQLGSLRNGDWVEFEDKHGRTLRGVVTNLNRRTISIEVDHPPGEGIGRHWRVSASLVRRIHSGEVTPAGLPSGRSRTDTPHRG